MQFDTLKSALVDADEMLTQQAKRLKTLEENKILHTEIIKKQTQAIADMAMGFSSTVATAQGVCSALVLIQLRERFAKEK